MRELLSMLLVASLALTVSAQETQPKPADRSNAPPKVVGDRSASGDQDISMPEEMRIRLAIERAEGEHRRVLEDVKKLSDLSGEIFTAYRDRQRLSSDDIKKLSTIEKLAKHILTHAGGSEVDDKSSDTEGLSLGDAVQNLNTAATRIKDDMSAETRHVVSATVIARSNEVITLSHLIRRKQKKD